MGIYFGCYSASWTHTRIELPNGLVLNSLPLKIWLPGKVYDCKSYACLCWKIISLPSFKLVVSATESDITQFYRKHLWSCRLACLMQLGYRKHWILFILKSTTHHAITCSKLTIESLERQWRRSGVFIVNFEYISHIVPVFLSLTLSR